MHRHSQAAAAQGRRTAVRLLVLLLGAHVANGQLSKPIASNRHWEDQHSSNKFLRRQAHNDKAAEDDQQAENEEFGGSAATNICPLDIELKWMTEVSSSVYATPLITDLYADGRKDVIVPGFVHYTDVLEGPDGAKALGWPAFHRSRVHASPLLYDIDMDGIRDVVVATFDGEVLFYKDNGEDLFSRLYIPRLRVKKHWFVGLAHDPVDHSHPDVGAAHTDTNVFQQAAQDAQHQVLVREQHAAHAAAAAHTQHGQHTAAGAAQHATPTPAAAHQPQLQQHAGAHIPATPLPAAPPPQQQQQQQPPQRQPPPQQAVQPVQPVQPQQTAQPLAAADQAAVAAFRHKLEGVEKQFGKPAADLMLQRIKGTNPALFGAVSTLLNQEKELEQLAGSFGGAQQGQGQARHVPGHPQRRLMSQGAQTSTGSDAAGAASLLEPFGGAGGRGAPGRHLLQAAADGATQPGAGVVSGAEQDPAHKGLTQEAVDSFRVFEDPPTEQQQAADAAAGQAAAAAADAAAAAEDAAAAGAGVAAEGAGADASGLERQGAGQLPDVDEFGDAWSARAHGDAPREGAAADDTASTATSKPAITAAAADGGNEMWDDESFQQAQHRLEEEFVYVDAHVLCTPAIADIDGDGHEEIVLSVSYYYEKEYYDDPQHANELQGVDKDKYVAGGIAVFDLHTRFLKWHQHLDLTTADTKFTAHIFSSPTLADLDGDGTLDIIVGTSVGFVYVLDHKGNTRPGWPVQMGEVQGQVLVADLNADGKPDIFAADTLGNVALLDRDGRLQWEKHVASLVGQGAVAGDINGDGLLEIVFGSADGRVHALRGTDGAAAPHFPFQTGGKVQAPATVAPLLPAQPDVQHILVMSFDGFLYAINGASGCAHTVDIGESSYAAVLVDDLCGDGALELLVSTMNGNVYMLQTRVPYHPLKTWPSQVQGVNGLLARWNYFGVAATLDSRQLRDVAGDFMQLQLEVTDKRVRLEGGVPDDAAPRGPYNVTVLLKGVGVPEMNAGPQPIIGLTDTVPKPGKHLMGLTCPRTRTTAAVHIETVAEHGLRYVDEFVVSFHMHFHKLLKWLVALPLLGMALVVAMMGQALGYADTKNYHLG